MDRGAWRATVRGAAKSRTTLMSLLASLLTAILQDCQAQKGFLEH